MTFTLALASCGGGSNAPLAPRGTGSSTSGPVVVTINPATSALQIGGVQSFTATVTGATDTTVTWTANQGTITGTGATINYSAPLLPGTFTVTATSNADNTKSASAQVVVSNTAPSVSVSINPTLTALLVGGTQNFTATVIGATNTAVTWAATQGSITSAGTYTAPNQTGTFTVTATSVADPTKSATATVGVISLSISPTSSTILTQAQQNFTVTVAGSSAVSLGFSATAGTVVASGNTAIYTAPNVAGTYTVTAAVVGAPSVSVSATVTVVAMTITPSNPTLLTSGSRILVFNANFPGGVASPVTFSASVGTLIVAGTTATYTAPTAPGVYTVTATSVTNPSVTAIATITVVLPSVTLFEVDGVTQSNRPVTFGRVFAQGEIMQCPQPVVGVTPIANYQADVKNRWPDNSVKFAIITLMQTLSPASSTTVTFQDTASCNNTGSLSQAQMAAFNSGNWGAQMVVSAAGSTSVTADAKTMLAASDPSANTFGDCKNDYWLQGPVVTAVIVQDCTAASASDFGWTWNGITMSSPVTGNDPHASFHPMFILYFYPGSNNVQVEAIAEMPWSGRAQDQLADLEFKSGSPLTSVWKHAGARRLTDVKATNGSAQITSANANFSANDVGLPIFISGSGVFDWYTIKSVTNATTAVLSDVLGGPGGSNLITYINLQGYATRHRKTFWGNTNALGHIRIDHNFAYLKFTKAFPNYDPNVSVSPDNHDKNNQATAWANWSATDKGDIGGYGGLVAWTQDYSGDGEGAPLQREDLLYLYNMGTCGTANSACAKAWQMLTGESGGLDTSLTAGNVTAGGGAWYNTGNVPFHIRESRTTATGQISSGNSFYCPDLADKNADPTNTTTCGIGTGNATGKTLSKHAHSDSKFLLADPPVAAVGNLSSPAAGWTAGGCDHWLDYAYTPYLLTGSPTYLEDEYQSASFCLNSANPTNFVYTSNGFFGYMNPIGSILRTYAWGLQTTARAAFVAPDNTPEASYYLAMMNSNLEVQEGVMGVTGTSLTPTDTSCKNASVPNYDFRAANRWNWGRCTVMSTCVTTGGTCTTIPNPLHAAAAGTCPDTGEEFAVNPLLTSAWDINWMYNAVGVVTAELRDMGFTQAAGVNTETQKQLVEKVKDSTYNPYLIALGIAPLRDATGGTACSTQFGQNTDPFINTYAKLKLAAVASNVATFDFNTAVGSFGCADHGYSLIARAAGTYLQQFNASSNDPNCPNGVCTASDAWAWLDKEVPYFNNSPTTSVNCVTPVNWKDAQIKYALTPR